MSLNLSTLSSIVLRTPHMRTRPLPLALRIPRAWGVGLLAISAIFCMAFSVRADAARIVVTVDGLHSSKGSVYVALYSKPDEFPDGDHSDRHVKLKAIRAPLTVTFDHLRPGIYAVGAYHDENDNARLDTNFFGYPVEGYALSNGIRAIISRPRFADAAFAVAEGEKKVKLHIEY